MEEVPCLLGQNGDRGEGERPSNGHIVEKERDVWTDGPRLDSRRVGAAAAWQGVRG